MADDRIESLAMNGSASSPKWMRNALLAAGAYNILWGAFAVIVPNMMFDLLRMARPTYPPVLAVHREECGRLWAGLWRRRFRSGATGRPTSWVKWLARSGWLRRF